MSNDFMIIVLLLGAVNALRLLESLAHRQFRSQNYSVYQFYLSEEDSDPYRQKREVGYNSGVSRP